ncbi:unnamed protein product [Absidia cylindrospora]
MATEHGSFDGGDQGLLNSYFSNWSQSPSAHRLPFTYNTTPTSQYSYAPAHQHYSNNIAICHFIGLDKPWKYQRFSDGNVISRGWKGLTDLVQSWWDTWNLYYGQNLPHVLLSKSPKDTLLISHATTPIKLFSNPIANAWDTPSISEDIELHKHHRHPGSMPPLENITINTPSWAPQEVQASSYPGLSEIHALDSSIDEYSQYSSHNNETNSSVADSDDLPDTSTLVFRDNKRTTEDCETIQRSVKSVMDDDNDNSMYQTIDWNPAYEAPPNTGIAANIPDLSTFVNAWDQPFQVQHVWVPPEPQPLPKMDHDYGFVHEHHQHHEREQTSSPDYQQQHQHQQSIFPWETTFQQTVDPTRIWLDEQILLAPTDHPHTSATNDTMQSYEQQWDNRISQTEHINNDHQQHLEQQHLEQQHLEQQHLEQQHMDGQNINLSGIDYTGTRENNAYDYHGSHQQNHQYYCTTETQSSFSIDSAYNGDQNDEQRTSSTPTYAMDLISPSLVSPGQISRDFIRTHPDNNAQTENDWSDRDLIPIQLKSSSKLNIDGLSPIIPSSPIGSRRSSLSRSRRPSISSIKSYHSTSAGSVPLAKISSSPSAAVSTGPLDYSGHSHQPPSIFAQETLSYSKKTPYTSAATTPVRERMSFLYETDEQQGHILDRNEKFEESSIDNQFEVDPLEDYALEYSFEKPLKLVSSRRRQNPHYQQTQWNPQAALERLQHTSEFIMRQHGQKSSSSMEDDRHVNKSTESRYALDAITIEKSPQEDNMRQFYASGSSSPRTPLVQGLESNLAAEIEAAKEQHRQQQRASLSLLQPRAAVASLLEAELDLSKSNLFNRRNEHNHNHDTKRNNPDRNGSPFLPGSSTESPSYATPANTIRVVELHGTGPSENNGESDNETPASNVYDSNKQLDQELQQQYRGVDHQISDESFTAYFDTSVIEAARRKLIALTQNVSVTSMSSTATMNERQDDNPHLGVSHGGSLENLSRYSFPPAHVELPAYQQTPTTNTTFDEQDLELASSTSSTLHEKIQVMDHHSEDMRHLQLDTDNEMNSTTYNETSNPDDEDFNINNHNISTWLSLTAGNIMDSTQNSDDTIESIDNNHEETPVELSANSGSCYSEDDDDNIIISTVDYITEREETDTISISETMHTHSHVKATDSTSSTTPSAPQEPTVEMELLDSMDREETRSSRSSIAATPRQSTVSVPLSAITLSMIPATRDDATTSAISVSDDGDTTFLSAVDGTLTPSGSSSISSTVEWYTVGSSTPVIEENDSNYGSEEEHETAVSLLEMRTHTHTATRKDTDATITSSYLEDTATNPPSATSALSPSASYSTALYTFEESFGPSLAATTSSSSPRTSANNSNSYYEEDIQHTTASIENIDLSDSLSIESQHTETGPN